MKDNTPASKTEHFFLLGPKCLMIRKMMKAEHKRNFAFEFLFKSFLVFIISSCKRQIICHLCKLANRLSSEKKKKNKSTMKEQFAISFVYKPRCIFIKSEVSLETNQQRKTLFELFGLVKGLDWIN